MNDPINELFNAIKKNDLSETAYYLDQVAASKIRNMQLPDLKTGEEIPVLNYLIQHSSPRMLKFLLIRDTFYIPHNALKIALKTQHLEMINILLDNSDFSLNCYVSGSQSPNALIFAYDNAYHHLFTLLLDHPQTDIFSTFHVFDTLYLPLTYIADHSWDLTGRYIQPLVKKTAERMLEQPTIFHDLFQAHPSLVPVMSQYQDILAQMLFEELNDLMSPSQYVALLQTILDSQNKPPAKQHPLYVILSHSNEITRKSFFYASTWRSLFVTPPDILTRIQCTLSQMRSSDVSSSNPL